MRIFVSVAYEGDIVRYRRYVDGKLTNEATAAAENPLSAHYIERFRRDAEAFYRYLGIQRG